MNPLTVLAMACSVLAQNANTANNNNNQAATGSTSASASASSSGSSSSSSESALYDEYGVLEFSNLGFEGYYKHVKTLDDSDSCSCELASNSERTIFNGTNAPINEEVSVHFRGPLILKQFAYYVAESYEYGEDSSDDWTRLAYYDSSSQTTENVTFLTHAGDNSTCLGKALSYAGSDGVSEADDATVLADDTLIASDDEYVIFSNISCDDSGFDNDCGVYRDDIPAYHGFYGVTKMFLFEFEAPDETSTDEDAFDYYNMPAIWLLNANIPRTSQYPSNENCSCWATGCGEFDIFEVMNNTESEHFYTTLHDYQGTGIIGTGIPIPGWIKRDTSSTMKGGVVFGSDGNALVFLSNSTSIDDTVAASDVDSWISTASSDEGEKTDTLVSATNTGSGSVSSAGQALMFDFDVRYVFAAFAVVGLTSFF